jgi:hypothetical protein
MDDLSKIIGENGCEFIDNSVTNDYIYAIYVQEDTVFSVLTEGALSGAAGSGTDIMTTYNLTGKTIKAGVILTPFEDVFRDVSLTSGGVIAYKVGR